MASAETAAWTEYLKWNAAIAEVFYPESDDGRPVYLDVDDEQFPALAAIANCREQDVQTQLCDAARGVLRLNSSEPSMLGSLSHRSGLWLRSWRKTPAAKRFAHEPPPVLAFLAVLSRAADLMGADEQYANNNYYGRLNQLLRVETPRAQKRLTDQYRKHGEALWKLLDVWLIGLDSLRGVPSAFAVSHRYVGLPMSQALVRSRDRAKMHSVFADLGLAAGQQMSSEEMERLLEPYMTSPDSPLSRTLARLWRREGARERIASVATIELESWTGPTQNDDASSPAAGELRLALLQKSFPVPTVEISVFVRSNAVRSEAGFTIESVESDEKPVLPFAAVSGWLRPVRATGIEIGSLLNGVLRLRDERGNDLQRMPRRVVPLRWDELAGAYIEVERVTLTEDFVLLSREESADAVAEALGKVAREGWQRESKRSGLPAEWVLFASVQVLGVLPPGGDDLNVLIPHVRSQVSFSGGMRLPGGIRKFSSLAPPEIRFALEGADRVNFTLMRDPTWEAEPSETADLTATADTVLQQTVAASAGVIPLASCGLADGDYELRVVPEPEGRPQVFQLRLRSGDSVDSLLWTRSPRLVHDLELGHDPGWGLISAAVFDDDCQRGVDGATPFGEPQVAMLGQPAEHPWWAGSGRATPAPAPTLRVATPDPAACINTGRHRIELPTYYGGRVRGTTIEGRCSGCGIVKRYPTYLRRHRSSRASHERITINLREVPPVRAGDLSWDVALDAMMHAGGGAISSLERVALQMQEEASSLFVDQFARTLIALGHVDIARDPTSLRPTTWEITPSALAGTETGNFLCIGYWPADLRRRLSDKAEAVGAEVVGEAVPDGPTRWSLTGCSRDVAQAVAADFEDEGVPVAVNPHAGLDILALLPGLSVVERSLPTIPLPGGRASRFDVSTARWVEVADAATVGSYRLQAFTTWDVVRREENLEAGTAAVATVQLSKHLEAHRVSRPLVAYQPKDRLLLVPLGCDLPGMIGRGAVLLSGRLPAVLPESRCLAYHDVSPDAAARITGLLSN
jgi:hypothetical protein